ncbi:hypothetical protein [Haloprofundus salilacus]|uniref:hypothetical protein n=1 Tax=Haloprofundus salilacus TaxID=2876190 RepID=UPI001CCA2BEA|nr:hypothetical protein [Haloprofundus salilacus]
MQRRALLASSASMLVGLAGCQFAPSDEDLAEATQSETSMATPAETEAETPDPTLVGDSPGESRFADESCPNDVDGCYHESTAETAIYLRPSAEEVEIGDEAEFSLVNRLDGRISINPFAWTIWRERDGGWENVDVREMIEEPADQIPSGESWTWTVPVDTEGDRTYDSDRAAVGVEFESGRYCLDASRAVWGVDTDRVALGALFEVV